MKKRILCLLVLMLMFAVLVTGCASADAGTETEEEEKTVIKIGTSSVSKDLAESGKESLEAMGYEVEITVFDDYVLPNEALVEETLDANFYQHEPYMNNYNNSNGTDIVMMRPKLYNFYTGIYSVKANSIEDLPKGGAVGIGQDASNISQQLKQLTEAQVMKLSDEPASGEFFTVADIIDNPSKYDFVQSDHMKYLNMHDYTIVVGTSNTMAEIGVDPTENILMKFTEDDLMQGISVLEKNKDTQWAKDIMEAYMSEEAVAKVPASSGFEYTAE